MNPSQAAAKLGYTTQHVRLLLRRGTLAGKKVRKSSPVRNLPVYEWDITPQEVERYAAERRDFGRPRTGNK